MLGSATLDIDGGRPDTAGSDRPVSLADVRTALQAILAQAGDDTQAGILAIQNWYDGAKDRAQDGAGRRRSRTRCAKWST